MKGVKCWFTAEGLNIERFVRKLSEAGIQLIQMKRKGRLVCAQVFEDDFSRIQEVADQGGWRLVPRRRTGIGRYLDVTAKHRGLLCAIVVFSVLLFMALQLVWCVDVSGPAIYQVDVKRFLNENDIHPMMWQKNVNLSQLRDTLEWRYPEVAWVDCGWRGNVLCIQLIEGVPEGEAVTTNGSGDIVASRGGVVEQIITLAGTSIVQPGDIVQEGQVLIQGTERGSEEESIAVMARGIVMARVWDQASVKMDITETVTDYTGNEQTEWRIICPWFPLWTSKDSAYAMQDVTRTKYQIGGLFFPFVLEAEHYREATAIKRTRTMTEMKAEAGEAALRALQNKIGIHDELVDKWVDYCMIEDEVLCANAYGERVIDIARPSRNAP